MPTSKTPPLSVVVIDDAEDLRMLLCNCLERSGGFHVVAEAGDGQQGVEAVVATHPDVVLLDIAMPVMDGLQALTLIRDQCPTSIVVMLSAFSEDSGLPQKALAAGACGYIHKDGRLPALPEQLRVIVGSVNAERAARLARKSTQHASPGSVG